MTENKKYTFAEAFRTIREIVNDTEKNKYQVRLVCELTDVADDTMYKDKHSEAPGYYMFDFAEEVELGTCPTFGYDWEMIDFKDTSVYCFMTKHTRYSSDAKDIHSKRTLIMYLFQLWKRGRIKNLYQDCY